MSTPGGQERGHSISAAAQETDRQLVALDERFDFLLQVTPLNARSAWEEFERGGCERAPRFEYRPLPFDPDELRRHLAGLPVDAVEDPLLHRLFREKQRDLDRQLSMLLDRENPRFLPASVALYGAIPRRVLAAARWLLDEVEPRMAAEDEVTIDAEAFAAAARRLIDGYRRQLPELDAQVHVRPDIYAGLLVSHGQLMVGDTVEIPVRRVAALLAHEVGTHVLTCYNGRSQPLRQFAIGLAGYDELQEGLAVLAEHLVGGLDTNRLRLLAARVVAAQAATDGADFVAVYRRLHQDHGFTGSTSYTLTTRVFRGGGLTKDAVYLRGLLALLTHLRSGGELEPLYRGKIGVEHIPLVDRLEASGALRKAPLRPHFLDLPQVRKRLERIRTCDNLTELVD